MASICLKTRKTQNTRNSISNNKTRKSTHLFNNDKNLEEINICESYHTIEVLYLQSNQISAIKNLSNFQSLTHLYLQWNKISRIENLNCLRNLEKLYLGYNMVHRLENIEKLSKLKELHIEKQNIEEANFTFDLVSMKSIAKNLQVLNISELKLKTLEPISICLHLKHLIANGNCFEDADEIGHIFGRMKVLEKADIHDCPAQKDTHYREKIIAGSNNLLYLNGKYITPISKVFIKRFAEMKNKRNSKSEISIKSKPKKGKDAEKSIYSLNIQNAGDELGFRAWNSLNSSQKPMHRMVKTEIVKSRSEYSLQGRHISNEQN